MLAWLFSQTEAFHWDLIRNCTLATLFSQSVYTGRGRVLPSFHPSEYLPLHRFVDKGKSRSPRAFWALVRLWNKRIQRKQTNRNRRNVNKIPGYKIQFLHWNKTKVEVEIVSRLQPNVAQTSHWGKSITKGSARARWATTTTLVEPLVIKDMLCTVQNMK